MNTFSQTTDEDKTMIFIRVAMCQIFCLDGDRSGNLVRIENAVQEAKEKGADIICFPEAALYGWVNPDAHQRACPIPGKDSNRLCELAKTYETFLCIGLAEKNEDKLYDSVILIDDEGTILLKHRKINLLTDLMTPSYTPGDEIKAVNTKFGLIGLMICADTFLEDNLQRMAELQPDLVLVPYGWAAEEKKWPQHGKSLANTVSNAAKVIHAPVAGTDLVGEITHGPWTGRVYGGQSVAADKEGQILTIAKDRDRDIKLVTIEIDNQSQVLSN